jgi:hypothetical protein
MFRIRIGLGLVVTVVLAGAGAGMQACGGNNNVTPGFDSGDDIAAMDVTTSDGGDGAPSDSGNADVGCLVGCSDSGPPPPPNSVPLTCPDAIMRNSYFGCDYFPTVTLNPVWPNFDFAVAVSNPHGTMADMQDVTVTISGGALQQPMQVTVPAGQVQSITLPWVPALKGPTFDNNTAVRDPGASRIVTGGAYHLSTDYPVSVYQFSALEYALTQADLIEAGVDAAIGTCPGYSGEGGAQACYAYSNDASLLLPTNVATGDYGILAWPSFAATPGFLAVVATQDGTNVTVFPAGRTQGVPDAGPSLLLRGDNATYQLNTGDVLEMFSDTGDIHNAVYTQDLSGTIVEADHPIVTYAGHGCTFIPQNKRACDHLESSMFPIETLGQAYVVTLPHTPHMEHEWVRIMAFYDNTKIAFDPPVSGYNGAVLNTGEVLDLPDVDQPFAMLANGRVEVATYQLGEFANFPDDAAVPNPDEGDPSETPSIPITQYRTQYTFLAPGTYEENWVDLVLPLDKGGNPVQVILDGNAIPAGDCHQVGGQPFCVAHEQFPQNGPEGHSATSQYQFGLYVYGYGSRTSYMYPGGLDLQKLTIPPPPM